MALVRFFCVFFVPHNFSVSVWILSANYSYYVVTYFLFCMWILLHPHPKVIHTSEQDSVSWFYVTVCVCTPTIPSVLISEEIVVNNSVCSWSPVGVTFHTFKWQPSDLLSRQVPCKSVYLYLIIQNNSLKRIRQKNGKFLVLWPFVDVSPVPKCIVALIKINHHHHHHQKQLINSSFFQ